MNTPCQFAFLLVNQNLASSVTGSIDLLQAANTINQMLNPGSTPLFDWVLATETGMPVTTFSAQPQMVDLAWDQLSCPDVIFVPGVFMESLEKIPGCLDENQPLQSQLIKWHAEDVLIATSCSASFFLAETGLLDGLPATTSWWASEYFASRYPRIQLQADDLLTHNGRLVCSGAAMTSLDMTLYLIRLLAGGKLAKLVSRYMLVDSNRHTQAAYRVPVQQGIQDRLLLKAMSWIRKHLQQEISVHDLAQAMHVSTRTLVRRFNQHTGEGPQVWIQKQRIDSSRQLFETTHLSLDEIVYQVGYADVSSFRRLFKRHTGLTPREYRHRFATV
ncbi:MAG: helix-turn-helix domain-containing protein [Gammaproteobacteria bacterium]